MQTVEEFAGTFPNELVLQQALAKLLSKIPNHSGVQILQGSHELGKDIIFYTPAAFGQKDLNACVVKNTKITGNASTSVGARTVFNQAQQALDSPVLDENGHEQHVKRVFIITPYPIPPETVNSIAGALKTSDRRVQFVSGATLLDLFKQHWPEYLAEEYSLIQTYADGLTQTAAVAKELDGLSFHYQLGTVSTSIKRVYVQPHFHRFLRSYSLRPLRVSLKLRLSDSPHTEDRIEGMKAQVNDISAFMGTIAEWGLIGESERRTVRVACKQLVDEMAKSWSLALAGHAARTKAGKFQSDSKALKLSNVYELNKLLDSVENTAVAALNIFERSLESAKQYMKQGQTESIPRFSFEHETIVNKLNEVARISGSQWLAEGDEQGCTFTAAAITNYDGSLFIVAPAGFGKTTFCRWNALNDLERLLQGESNTLPVYVPLHQVSVLAQREMEKGRSPLV